MRSHHTMNWSPPDTLVKDGLLTPYGRGWIDGRMGRAPRNPYPSAQYREEYERGYRNGRLEGSAP